MVKVIGLCGSIGAGKGVVSDILVNKYGYTKITIGDIVRDYVKSLGLEITRDNTDKFSEEIRQKRGVTYWVQKCIDKILKMRYDKVVMDGVRLPSDNNLLKNTFKHDYLLLKVDANPITRFERLKKRGRPGFPNNIKKFKEHEERQRKMFNLDKTFEQVDEVIDNSTTINDLKKRVELLTKKYSDWF